LKTPVKVNQDKFTSSDVGRNLHLATVGHGTMFKPTGIKVPHADLLGRGAYRFLANVLALPLRTDRSEALCLII
jgi:hypothetical protein